MGIESRYISASGYIQELISEGKALFVPDFMQGYVKGDTFRTGYIKACGYTARFKGDVLSYVSLLDYHFFVSGSYKVVDIGFCNAFWETEIKETKE